MIDRLAEVKAGAESEGFNLAAPLLPFGGETGGSPADDRWLISEFVQVTEQTMGSLAKVEINNSLIRQLKEAQAYEVKAKSELVASQKI